MAQLTREGRVLPEAAGGSPVGPHPDRGLGSLTSIWAPNHLFSCSPDPRQQPLCSGPWAGLSEAATAWLVFSDYLASAPGEQAGVCHTAGAHRNQWQSLHGKEGDPGDAGAEAGLAGQLPVAVGTPWRTPSKSRRACQGSSCIHTWTDAICGNEAAMWPAARIVPHRSGPRVPFQNPPEPEGLWLGALSCTGQAGGIQASVRRRGRKEVFTSQSCPSGIAAKDSPSRIFSTVMAPHI